MRNMLRTDANLWEKHRKGKWQIKKNKDMKEDKERLKEQEKKINRNYK